MQLPFAPSTQAKKVIESSRSAGRARQRETVGPTSWSKPTLLQHLAEVILATLWRLIDRLSSPRNWPSCCQNFLADTDGADENCNTYKAHAPILSYGREWCGSLSEKKHTICQFTGILSSTRVIKGIVIKKITIRIPVLGTWNVKIRQGRSS